jgi:hypothetical protein
LLLLTRKRRKRSRIQGKEIASKTFTEALEAIRILYL